MSTAGEHSNSIVDFILELFADPRRRGVHGRSGQYVATYGTKCGLRGADNAPDSLVIAALLHDIGHFIGEHPIEALENGIDNHHETAGADYLAPYFPPAITEPIRLHVAAKRYLCATDDEYRGHLSDASVHSLMVQGGPMSADEVATFEANPYHGDAVGCACTTMTARSAGLTIRPVSDYRDMLESQLLS